MFSTAHHLRAAALPACVGFWPSPQYVGKQQLADSDEGFSADGSVCAPHEPVTVVYAGMPASDQGSVTFTLPLAPGHPRRAWQPYAHRLQDLTIDKLYENDPLRGSFEGFASSSCDGTACFAD